VRNNPLKYVDPTGHCPKPMDSQDKANVICVAFFIPTKRSNTIPIIGRTFVGDGRDFSWNSDEDGSRGWVHLDADTGEIIKYKFHRTEDADTGEKWDPLKDNTLKSEIQEDGSIKLKYSFYCSAPGPLCSRGPQGEITFSKNDFGTFDSSGNVEGFPNIEAYHWKEGQPVSMLFRVQNFSRGERQTEMGSTSTGMRMGSLLTDNGTRYEWNHEMRKPKDGLTVDFSTK
jgi:hypothetical protein